MTPSNRRRLRLLGGLGFLLLAGLGGRALGLDQTLGLEELRAEVGRLGSLGMLVYVVAFTVGLLLYIPGTFFVGSAILIYGRPIGFGVAFAGSIVAVSTSFLVIRSVGGGLLRELDRPLLTRMLNTLDARPIMTVLILRVFFFLAPPLNYALALSSIRFRDYILGSTLGLLPQLIGATFLSDWIIRLL